MLLSSFTSVMFHFFQSLASREECGACGSGVPSHAMLCGGSCPSGTLSTELPSDASEDDAEDDDAYDDDA